MTPDRLVGISEIAKHFGRGESTIRHWRTHHEDFPEPIGTVSKNPAWWLSVIVEWRKRTARKQRAQSV